jgi:hypothetical protein
MVEVEQADDLPAAPLATQEARPVAQSGLRDDLRPPNGAGLAVDPREHLLVAFGTDKARSRKIYCF